MIDYHNGPTSRDYMRKMVIDYQEVRLIPPTYTRGVYLLPRFIDTTSPARVYVPRDAFSHLCGCEKTQVAAATLPSVRIAVATPFLGLNLRSRFMSKPPRRRMIPLFHKLVDLMIREPHLTHEELGNKVGRSRHTIGHIVTSDIFKYHLNKKREEYSLAHQAAISYQLGRTMNAALKACADAIELGESNPRFALEVVKELKELTTERPYREQEHNSTPSVHISIGGDTIVRARERARIAHSSNAEIEDESSGSNPQSLPLIEGGATVREESKQVPEE